MGVTATEFASTEDLHRNFALQKIIMEYVDLKDLRTDMAQEIINKMNVWIKKG